MKLFAIGHVLNLAESLLMLKRQPDWPFLSKS